MLEPGNLVGDAQQALNMVPDLVRNHIGLGKVARCAQTGFQGVVEAQIDVDLLVRRAIKRPHGGLALATGRGCGAAKQHQRGIAVGGTAFGENVTPYIFGVGQQRFDELLLGVIRRRILRRRLLHLPLGCTTLCTTQYTQNRQGVDTEYPSTDQRNDDGADANAATAEHGHATARAAPVFHVVRLAVAFPLHACLLRPTGAWMASVPRRRGAPPRLRSWAASRRAGPGTCRRGPCSWSRRLRRSRRTAPGRSPRRRRSWPAAAWCC